MEYLKTISWRDNSHHDGADVVNQFMGTTTLIPEQLYNKKDTEFLKLK